MSRVGADRTGAVALAERLGQRHRDHEFAIAADQEGRSRIGNLSPDPVAAGLRWWVPVRRPCRAPDMECILFAVRTLRWQRRSSAPSWSLVVGCVCLSQAPNNRRELAEVIEESQRGKHRLVIDLHIEMDKQIALPGGVAEPLGNLG